LGGIISERRRDMPRFSKLSLLIGLLFVGCAVGRSFGGDLEEREPAGKDGKPEKPKITVAQESIPVNEDNSAEQLRALEKSVSMLSSEVKELRNQLNRFQVRAPVTVYKLPEVVSICGERVPLEDKKVWEVLDQEFLSVLGSEIQVLLWMKRARRYFPHIEKKLSEMNLPDDLKYLAVAESSLRPYAVSSARAAGVGQFTPSTGGKYGMPGNRDIDERFDVFKATEGALTYLKTLYEEFRNWPLAMAAYNTGETRIRREVALQKTCDYFHLDLPLETERYVYKIAVAKIILSDPKKYGFSLEEDQLYDALQLERVQIELPIPLPVIDVALAIGVYYKDIKEMNLHLTGEVIPSGVQALNLPPGSSEKFWTFFKDWKKTCPPKKNDRK
jgi:membrane-bound lytic murein transglycosylase D